MSVKNFVFCDICNRQGIRYREERRQQGRDEIGRRISDGRHWFEGSLEESLQAGWMVDRYGRHVCQRCREFLEMDGRMRKVAS